MRGGWRAPRSVAVGVKSRHGFGNDSAGFGQGDTRDGCGGGGVSWFMEAGETVSDDLGGGAGFGGGFVDGRLCGGVCGGFLCGGASGGGHLGAFDQVALGVGGEGGPGAGDDEDLFELGEVGGGMDLDEGVGLVVGVGGDGLDGADVEAAGVDLVAAGAEDGFARLDAGVGGEVGDDGMAGGVAVEDGANAGGGEDDAGARGSVIDFEHLGGVGKDVAELADDAIGGDDGHVGFESVGGAFIDVEDAGEVAAAGADDLGGYGGVDVVLLEGEKGLEALTLQGIFGDGGLLKAKLAELLLEVVILLADMTQVDVVVPGAADGVADGEQEALERGDGGDGPIANEAHLIAVGRTAFDGPADLNGQAYGLCEQDDDQHESVSVTDEKRVHALTAIIPRDGDSAWAGSVTGGSRL